MALEWPASTGDSPPLDSTHLVGVDEAGRGPVLGPLVVAALAVPSYDGDRRLRELAVRDSKRLQATRRERLAKELAVFPSRVVEVPAEDIDALRCNYSLNVIEARVFATAVLTLLGDLGEGVKATVYMDAADVSESTFERHFMGAVHGDPRAAGIVHVVCRHEADDCFPVVSAASIVAKSRREAAMGSIREELGEEVGSGYSSDRRTMEFLEKWISEKGNLPPHTRASWRPAQRLLERYGAGTVRLSDFDCVTEDE